MKVYNSKTEAFDDEPEDLEIGKVQALHIKLKAKRITHHIRGGKLYIDNKDLVEASKELPK